MEEYAIEMENWWSILIRGIIAIAIGIILLAWPASTIRVLAYVAGILFLLDGLIETVWSIVLLFRRESFGIIMARGIVGLLVGILLLAKTGFALTFVVILLAIWAIVSGFAELIVAFEMPPMSGRSLVGIAGLISVILGILLLALPLETVYVIIVVFCIFLILGGILRVIYSFLVRKQQKELQA